MHKKFFCLALSLLLSITCLAPISSVAAGKDNSNTQLNSETKAIIEQMNSDEYTSYYDYYNYYLDAATYSDFVKVKGTNFTKSDKPKVKTYDNVKAVVLDKTNEWVEYSITVPENAKYGIEIDYYQLPDKEKDIELTILIDGKIPYTEAQQVALPRLWDDDINPENVVEGHYFETTSPDGNSDDIRPSQKEFQIWTTRALINVRGLYQDPYQFYLTKGTHTVRLELDREAVAISEIRFGNKEEAISYDEYISQFSESDYVTNNGIAYGDKGDLSVTVQAEETYYKNNITLYATTDKSDPSVTPADAAYARLNTIGQANWSTNGDELVWKFNVKKAGLYKLTMRAHQNFNAGMKSYRTLKVNGEVPFKEAEIIKFEYKQNWYMLTLGNQKEGEEHKDYYIYLNEGDNLISLTCNTGEMSEVLRNIQQAVLDLNDIYRQIISVTSTQPDIYRDYSLEQQIPTLEDDLWAAKKFIDKTAKIIYNLTGTDGSQASSVNYVSQILGDLAADPYVIPERLSRLKDGIETLGSLITTISKLALELDYIAILPVDTKEPKVSKGFFNSVEYTWNQLVSSFTVDYNVASDAQTEGEDVEVVQVWVNTGRDQAKIINRLVGDDSDKLVTSDGKKISVHLALVDTGATLIRATLAGKGPDCALMIGEDSPMNLAARGALLPLTEYKAKIEDQFYPCAWTPFWYDGEYYALPETQSFEVMFYRTDVFKELGIEVPKTWDDFYKVMEILQNTNLIIGIPEVDSANAGVSQGIRTFDKFLVQNGGTYYNSNLSQTRFTDEVAYQAFERWVELYKKYGLDRSFDFYSRFRTGEMPLSIQMYTAYNQLKTAAPELNGLWSIAPIPGTVQKDGSINNLETSVVTGCILLKAAEKKGITEAASIFLSWWASADTQAAYARELEATLGIAARYHPANKEAFKSLAWTDEEAEVITKQWENVTVMNEIPGNYVLKRSLTSAFRNVIAGKNAARRALTIYNTAINDEIKRKRKEFGLE